MRPDYTKEFKQEIYNGLSLQAENLNKETYQAVVRYMQNGNSPGFTTYTAIEDLIFLMNKTQSRIKKIRDEMSLLSNEIEAKE